MAAGQIQGVAKGSRAIRSCAFLVFSLTALTACTTPGAPDTSPGSAVAELTEAPRSTVPVRDVLITGCPAGSVRTCEVVGGNKFKKRYGRCVCAAR